MVEFGRIRGTSMVFMGEGGAGHGKACLEEEHIGLELLGDSSKVIQKTCGNTGMVHLIPNWLSPLNLLPVLALGPGEKKMRFR
jgi:hypothetical protein